jgi:ADP-ribosyl-[dinitrogen reductase] hydrolase
VPTRAERIEGGLVGLLVGDALGVPYEFHGPRDLPRLEDLEPTPPPGFRRSHAGTPPGTWSDDGAQALCLLESLLECGRLDLDDFGRRLLSWANEGHLAVDARVFDIGNQTRRAFERLSRGIDAPFAGPRTEQDNGNGSLMRVLPLALWHQGTDAELAGDADLQSQITHGHWRSRIACAIAVLWARGLLEDRADPFEQAVDTVRVLYGNSVRPEIDLLASYGPTTGSGYVADTLASAREALRAGSYEAVVKRAVAFGNDTDTTACVAGGLAGVRDGIGAIPVRWRDQLRGRELLQPLLDRLLAS